MLKAFKILFCKLWKVNLGHGINFFKAVCVNLVNHRISVFSFCNVMANRCAFNGTFRNLIAFYFRLVWKVVLCNKQRKANAPENKKYSYGKGAYRYGIITYTIYARATQKKLYATFSKKLLSVGCQWEFFCFYNNSLPLLQNSFYKFRKNSRTKIIILNYLFYYFKKKKIDFQPVKLWK